MATKMGKRAVYREVHGWQIRGIFGMGSTKDIGLIVGIEPGNIISFREKGRRRVYDIDIESVYNTAVRRCLSKEEDDKKAKKKVKKLERRTRQ